MRRLTLSLFLAIGVGLIVVPLAMGMFSRASNGEKMVDNFRPIMQPAHVQTTADYYYNVFTKLRPFALIMPGVQRDAQKLIPALAQAMHTTPAKVQQMLATQFPSLAQMLQAVPQGVKVFDKVPPGLDWYRSLVQTMQTNVGNYKSVDELPAMGFFPWFFVIPGIMLVLAAAYLLVGDVRPDLVWPKLGPKPATPTAAH